VEALADPIGLGMRIVIQVWSIFSTVNNSSYSYRSGAPQYSVPRSIKTPFTRISCCSKTSAGDHLGDRQCHWDLAIIQFRKIAASDAFERSHLEYDLIALVARMLALEFAVGFFVRLLQRHDLGFRQEQPL
jgi:hypothetical protein